MPGTASDADSTGNKIDTLCKKKKKKNTLALLWFLCIRAPENVCTVEGKKVSTLGLSSIWEGLFSES